MTIAVANFIETLLVHYPVKHDSEEREDAWVDAMVAALKGYTAPTLQEVAQHIIRHRKYRNFPLLSEIMDAADKVEERQANIARAQTLPAMRQSEGDEWSTERRRLAHELKHTQIGRQAAKEGWSLAFWHFCRREQRVPQQGPEVERCKKNSRCLDEAVTLLAEIKPGPCMPVSVLKALEGWGDRFIDRNKEFEKETLGK